MAEIRKGDTIIASDMQTEWEVISHDHEKVKAWNSAGDKRLFHKDKLECVDPDDGLWQEMLG